MAIFESISEGLLNGYGGFISLFSAQSGHAVNVILMALGIVLVALFILYFYRSISQRNLISLNLNQYNTVRHPVVTKVLAVTFYFLEHIILMPFLILLWFAALSIIILVIAPERTAVQILTLTAAMVIAIRILAYWHSHSEIAKELAKLFPLITLSVFILSPGDFNITGALNRLGEIPSLFGSIFYFLLVIFIVEIILRFFYTILKIIRGEHKEKLPGVGLVSSNFS